MLRLLCAGICATLLYPTNLTLASTVFRCEDDKGSVTYTLHGCPDTADLRLQDAFNPTPGKGKPVPLAKAKKEKRSKAKTDKKNQPLVVGQKDDGCGNQVTGQERRKAIIQQKAKSGMTQADIESSLGSPDKITQQNGETRYHYMDNEGNRRQVTFDEEGCVKGKR